MILEDKIDKIHNTVIDIQIQQAVMSQKLNDHIIHCKTPKSKITDILSKIVFSLVIIIASILGVKLNLL